MELINNFKKHIHQIWFQEGDLNLQWKGKNKENYFLMQKSYIDFCTKKGWEYTLWRESSILELVKEYFPDYLEEFINLDSIIKKVDCSRLMILYVYGGVYVDVDSYLKRDLDEFLNLKEFNREPYNYFLWHINKAKKITHSYNLIAGQEKTVCEYHYDKFGITIPKINNAVIFCGPKLDILLKIIDKGFKRKDMSILNSFGVQTFSNTFYHYMRGFLDNLIDTQDYSLPSKYLFLPYMFFYEKNDIDDPRQFIVHKFDGNWDGEQYKDFIGKLTDNNISRADG